MVKIVDLKDGSLRFFFLEIYRSKIDLGKDHLTWWGGYGF